VDIDASGYATGELLMHGGRHVCYYSELFHGVVLNYTTYNKGIYSLVQDVKKWKPYLMGKENIIHTYHQPIHYLQAQSKLQQTRNYKWVGFLQHFHLVIKYNNGSTYKLEYMISRPYTSNITTLGTLMHMEPITHDAYKEVYTENEDFKEVFQ
jgi:hypothetical protein